MSRATIRNLSSRNWIIVVSSLIAIIFYFFPWIIIDKGGIGVWFIYFSGLKIALTWKSAIGIPWQVSSAVLISAVVCLILCTGYIRQGYNTKKIIPITQIFLSLVGLVPFVLLIFEIKTWVGGGTILTYFLYITILAMIGILIGSIMSYIEIHRHSTSIRQV